MSDSDDKDLIPNVNNDLEKWEDQTWGEYMLSPDTALMNRHRELCRLAAHGWTNKAIAEKLNYTQGRVSVLLSHPKIQKEVEIYRDRLFKVDEQTRMRELVTDAIDNIEQILRDPTLKPEKKLDASKWLIEKVTGKPVQATENRTEISLSVIYDKLDEMKVAQSARTTEPSVIDVSVAGGEAAPQDLSLANPPKAEEGEKAPSDAPYKEDQDRYDDWLDKYLGE